MSDVDFIEFNEILGFSGESTRKLLYGMNDAIKYGTF